MFSNRGRRIERTGNNQGKLSTSWCSWVCKKEQNHLGWESRKCRKSYCPSEYRRHNILCFILIATPSWLSRMRGLFSKQRPPQPSNRRSFSIIIQSKKECKQIDTCKPIKLSMNVWDNTCNKTKTEMNETDWQRQQWSRHMSGRVTESGKNLTGLKKSFDTCIKQKMFCLVW